MILVRATVNLPGLPRGEVVLVDPESPVIREYLKLETAYLVPVQQDAGVHLRLLEGSGSVEAEDTAGDVTRTFGESLAAVLDADAIRRWTF